MSDRPISTMPEFAVYARPDKIKLGEPALFWNGIVFIKRSFDWWAFLFGPIWLCAEGLWVALILYLIIIFIIFGFLATYQIIELFFPLLLPYHLWLGFKAGSLRRNYLVRRGYAIADVVGGKDLEDARRRFYDRWNGATPVFTAIKPDEHSGSIDMLTIVLEFLKWGR